MIQGPVVQVMMTKHKLVGSFRNGKLSQVELCVANMVIVFQLSVVYYYDAELSLPFPRTTHSDVKVKADVSTGDIQVL